MDTLKVCRALHTLPKQFRQMNIFYCGRQGEGGGGKKEGEGDMERWVGG